MTYWNHGSRRSVDIINGCFWLVRREAFEAVGPLDERFFIYGEDIDWCRRFHAANWEVVFYPDAKVLHYGGASSANAPCRFAVKQLKADLQYWNKYHGACSQILYYAIAVQYHLVRIAGYSLAACIAAGRRETALFKIRRSWHCMLFLLHVPAGRDN